MFIVTPYWHLAMNLGGTISLLSSGFYSSVAKYFTVIFQCGHKLLNIRDFKEYLTMDECGWSLTHVPCNHFFILYQIHLIL